MSLCRLHTTNSVIVKVIGTSLHNLEQLYLDDLKNNNFDDIKCLVTGCPELKILHVELGVTLEFVEYVLLGLPHLIEFKHPSVVFALEKIIQDGRADRIAAMRNVYIRGRNLGKFGDPDVLKSAQVVIKHLKNITILDIIVPFYPFEESLTTFPVTVSVMNHLTELTWKEFSCTGTIITPILEAVGHQLRLLDLRCNNYFWLDMIDQCKKLRVLRIANETYNQNESYSSDLHEQFTPFQYLQELHLIKLNYSHLKPALLKSLIASPVLRDLRLVRIPNFTDDIVKAAFSHVNHRGEQLAFTSLRKLKLWKCDFISEYLEKLVTYDGVPLELLSVEECLGVTEKFLWNNNKNKFILERK